MMFPLAAALNFAAPRRIIGERICGHPTNKKKVTPHRGNRAIVDTDSAHIDVGAVCAYVISSVHRLADFPSDAGSQHRRHSDRRLFGPIPAVPAHRCLLMSHACDDLQGLPSVAFFAIPPREAYLQGTPLLTLNWHGYCSFALVNPERSEPW
jgi:hypothetical protein